MTVQEQEQRQRSPSSALFVTINDAVRRAGASLNKRNEDGITHIDPFRALFVCSRKLSAAKMAELTELAASVEDVNGAADLLCQVPGYLDELEEDGCDDILYCL